MSVKWVELSKVKRIALRIIILNSIKNINQISDEVGVSRGSIFNKLDGKTKFKEKEYTAILNALGITDDTLEKCAQDYIISILK